ncbi:MAG TPA: hypothetical protein VF515_13865 [Candidatus Binatia bacterium]
MVNKGGIRIQYCALCGLICLLLFTGPAWASFAAYSLGDLNLQNGWDGGIVSGSPVPFANNVAGSDVIVNTIAFSGTQSWQFGGSYNSPGAGTPFTPDVATVGAPNATTAGSPITPAGDQSVISFAFKAIAPGDGSGFSVYEGSSDRTARVRLYGTPAPPVCRISPAASDSVPSAPQLT